MDGGNVVFVASGVEDPARKPATMAGFRGGRYISPEASARGKWETGGSKLPDVREVGHIRGHPCPSARSARHGRPSTATGGGP